MREDGSQAGLSDDDEWANASHNGVCAEGFGNCVVEDDAPGVDNIV